MEHTKINSGYFWVRLKTSRWPVPMYWNGYIYTAIGTNKIYTQEEVESQIRMKPPEFFSLLPNRFLDETF